MIITRGENSESSCHRFMNSLSLDRIKVMDEINGT